MTRLAMLGCGHMGRAMLKGLVRDGSDGKEPVISKTDVSVTSDSSATKLKSEFADHEDRVKIFTKQNVDVVKDADVVLLAFPPGQLTNALSAPGMKEALQDNKFIISILAGISQDQIRSLIYPNDDKGKASLNIVRAIPSMGAQTYESSTLLVDEEPAPPQNLMSQAEAIFGTIGKIHHTPENFFTSLTSLNGVCHALMSIVIDALADACVVDGVPREHTLGVAGQCFVGYAALIAGGAEPSALKNSLLIPNGLTANAMLSLEKGGVRKAIHDAVRETSIYTASMGKQKE